MRLLRVLVGLALIACGSSEGGGGGLDGGTAKDASSGGGGFTHYVSNSLRLGKTSGEAYGFAFDLDGDGQEDDQIGGTLALLASNLDADGRLDAAVKAGTIILLHSLQADSLTGDTSVGWRVLVGSAKTSPDFGGSGSFTVAPTSPTDAVMTGAIAAGVFTGGPATVTVELSLLEGQPPLRARLIGARMSAKVTAGGCSEGRLGGAITDKDINDVVLPALATGLESVIAADAGCKANVNDCEASTKTILSAFDGNGDRTITLAEVKNSLAVKLIFAPDLDLLNAQGSAGKDGVDESVSIAIGFTCVKATFTATGEN